MTSFDIHKAINLSKAALLVRGKGGNPITVETLRRWANPKRGCFPAGKEGPRLVLPTHKANGEILVMPDWVTWFEEERARLSERGPKPAPAPMPTTKQRRREIGRAAKGLDEAGIGVK